MTIRIAFFAPRLTTGGTQRHLQQVLALLDPRRFRAEVFTLRDGGEVERELRASGTSVIPLDVGTRLLTPHALQAMARGAWRLRRDRIDVVHGYQWRPSLVGCVMARLARVPVVIASKRSLTGRDDAARMAWRRIARLADTVVVNAAALQAEGEADGIRARWLLHQNGVDVDRYRLAAASGGAKARLGLDPDRPVVGAIGRLEHRKGQDQLLEATRALLGLANGLRPQLLIVGDGPTRGALERRAGDLGIAESVRFLGGVPDVRPALEAMDVFVLPSREEGMSNALLEAMAAERPIVATAVGGNGEVIDDGHTGVLVPAGDAQAMARQLLDLLGDPERAARLAAEARAAVTVRFGARASVAQLERLYEERLAAHGRTVR